MTWNRVDRARFHRLFYPEVPVVVTVGVNGRVGAMPAIWCMPLSFDPPLIGIAIAPEHETYKMIMRAGSFVVNWLDYSHAEQVGELGEISAKEYPQKLAAVGLNVLKKEKRSQPLIEEASAVLECRMLEKHRTGTHELIVAEVANAFAKDYFHDYWDYSKYRPLLYAGTTGKKRKSWRFMSTRRKTAGVTQRHGS